MSHASSARRRIAELVRINLKFSDEEIALKKALAEVKYKQQLIQMDLDLLAAKMADEFASACNEGMKWRLLKGLSMRLMTRSLFESI